MSDNNPPRRQPSRRAKKDPEENEEKKKSTSGSSSKSGGKPAATPSKSTSTGRTTTTTTTTTATTSKMTRGSSGASSNRGSQSSQRTTRGAKKDEKASETTAPTKPAATRSSTRGSDAKKSTAKTTTTTTSGARKQTASTGREKSTRSKGKGKEAISEKETIEYDMKMEEVGDVATSTGEKIPSTIATDQSEDIEMAAPDEETVVDAKTEAQNLLVADITQNFYLLQKAVATIESRFTTRVIRTLVSIRRRMDAEALIRAIQAYHVGGTAGCENLLVYLNQGEGTMEIDEPKQEPGPSEVMPIIPLPEIEMYLSLLVLVWLIDQKRLDQAIELSTALVQQITQHNRRTLDQIGARIFFYYARAFELSNRSVEIRSVLLASHRTANLRHDDESQATLINLLLRNYFQHKLYDQADRLASKVTFPETASNSQLARYMYYLGRIRALQLDYTESHKHLVQAIRKAPQNAAAAGFLQSVNKFSIIVELLMGEIPERSTFRQPMLRKALVPYFHLTQAVRVGDLAKFQDTLAKYAVTFRDDNTYTLILRLRHNVIKTGVRMINLSYSRISLRDICLKLHLDSEEDAEYIVAKAIRDGVIDATIDHEHGYIQSKENVDIYSTNEPQYAFNQRITFCLTLHDESVKAMRYPNTDKKDRKEDSNKKDDDRDMIDEMAGLMGELEDMEDDDDVLGDF